MKLSPTYLKRYREIGRMLWKYGRTGFASAKSGEDEVAEEAALESDQAEAEKMAADLEAMGPTYVKFGQVLASRPDLMPEAYLRALARLQDSVKPFPAAEAMAVVEAELDVRISKAFATFEPEPIAAASLAQVHYAELRDGRKVVVKVQRPNVHETVKRDFEALSGLAEVLDEHTPVGRRARFNLLVEEFRSALMRELNYELEARNLISLARNLQEFPRLLVPRPVLDYSTRRVLVMDYVDGVKVTKLGPLARQELDVPPLLDELFKAYLKQVLVDGMFHADPHPGNIFVTNDSRLALIDLGMVGHTSPGMQESLLKLLLAVSEGDGDSAAELVIRMSEKTEEFEPVTFRRRIGQLIAVKRDQGLDQMNVGRSLFDVSNRARAHGLFVPSELTLLGKTLLQLDEIGRTLDPAFQPGEAVRRQVTDLMSRRVRKDLTKGSVFTSMLEMKDFVQMLPERVNRILDAVTNSELEVKVKSVDAKVVLDGMQKIANRITAGLVLAALIIGASLLMRVQTRFVLFGYPGLAMLCFIAAAAGGFWLVFNIFVQDYRSRKKVEREH